MTLTRAGATDPPSPLLDMSGVGKSFSGVRVLNNVDFDLRAGEVHALVGENGAGKSTLIKILGGVHSDYEGLVRVDGGPVRFGGPRDAEEHGIGVIHQELSLIPGLSVAENIALGREPTGPFGLLRRRRMVAHARELLKRELGLELNVRRPAGEYPVSVQQLVEIAKALSRAARIVVMDEPSSALTDAETKHLFEIVERLRRSGVGIIYISHKMEEIYALADRVTVLRDGEKVGTADADELDQHTLVEWMIGREMQPAHRRDSATPGDTVLQVRDLWLDDRGTGQWKLRGVNLDLRAGEIVGLAGLLGSGKSELLGTIFGRFGRPPRGQVLLDGREPGRLTPRRAIAGGLALLTNDRKADGIVPPMSVLKNLTLASLRRCCRGGLLSGTRERRACRPLVERLRLRAPSLGAPIVTLSGGNQQKAIFARWLLAGPRVLLLDEPTRGIDVGAKADIYALLDELTAAGLAILLITSELPELLALADRILVMHRGAVVEEFSRAAASQAGILRAAMGA